MAGSREVRRAAEALSEHVRKSHSYHSRPVEQAVVASVSPLTAELVEGRLTLDETQLLLGFTARKYDQDHGIVIGDTLTLVEVSGDDYVVLEVHGSKEILKGVGTEPAAGTTKNLTGTGPNPGVGSVSVTVAMPVANWFEAFDAAGNHLGWVPIFASKT
jgi:hypothetical protein